MFEYIKGYLADLTPEKAILDVQGIGYKILIPLSVYTELTQKNDLITLYISAIYREDSQRLFGFISKSQRDLFDKLCDISGIGPKIALSLIGHMKEDELYLSIHHQDVKMLCQIPGLGKKTAERLIVEMKDKLKELKLPENDRSDFPCLNKSLFDDALSALINLGYQKNAAYRAIQKASKEAQDINNLSELITTALKKI